MADNPYDRDRKRPLIPGYDGQLGYLPDDEPRDPLPGGRGPAEGKLATSGPDDQARGDTVSGVGFSDVLGAPEGAEPADAASGTPGNRVARDREHPAERGTGERGEPGDDADERSRVP